MVVYVPVTVVNTFTPNGDGINDTWDIPSLSAYPNCLVNIFTRYGTMVYKSIGYAKAWDGTFNTQPVPPGTYYYIIDLKNGKDKITGAVTVLR
jgi:gliding motility-associated-like protein